MHNPFSPRNLPRPSRSLSASSQQHLADADAVLCPDGKPEFGPTLRLLKSVPKSERNFDWLERLITLYAMTDTKLARARALTSRYWAHCKSENDEARFKAFSLRLDQCIAPYRMTLHGKILPFKSRDPAPIIEDLVAAFAVLNQHGYQAFLNSGTLLGAIREGGFLPHDDDLDLGVFIKGDTAKERRESLRTLGRVIEQSGLSTKHVTLSNGGPLVKLRLACGVDLDLFAAWISDDRVYIWPHTYGELTADQVLPLGQARLYDVAMPAPGCPEDMLAVNYGPDWRSPDSTFRFDWRRAWSRFEEDIAVMRADRRSLREWGRRIMGQKDRP